MVLSDLFTTPNVAQPCLGDSVNTDTSVALRYRIVIKPRPTHGEYPAGDEIACGLVHSS